MKIPLGSRPVHVIWSPSSLRVILATATGERVTVDLGRVPLRVAEQVAFIKGIGLSVRGVAVR